jgi:uncharacterized protein YyaL (SSP411 family)
MAEAPAGLLSSRAASAVHWQHWEPAVLQQAADAKRLVFALIGSARYPGCVETLDAIDKDPALAARLNTEFIPVLVDLELSPEAGLAAAVLSQEVRSPVAFPFILVLSPEGNEVTWRPIPHDPGMKLRDALESAMDVVAKMWTDSPDYVLGNSRADHKGRIDRLQGPDPQPASPVERDAQLARGIRQLASLYEEDTGVMAGAGGLLPVGILQCLASASLDPDTAPELSRHCREIVAGLSKTLLWSAMVDPLDGGVYSSRRGNSWQLPVIQRTCSNQARTARALVTLYRATRDRRALDVALGAVKFAEQQYAAQNGLFAAQRMPAVLPVRDWLWTEEQIGKALTPQEAALWKAVCGISSMGNLTWEADITREHFRLNSLGFRSSLAASAAKLGIPEAEAAKLLESGRAKLLKARQERAADAPPCPAASATASFRMVSAYAALFTATGDVEWRNKALALAKRSRETFASGDLLKEQNPGVPEALCQARAITHALAIQAALDVAEITLDESWRSWAADLTTSVAEAFVDDSGRLREARPGSTPLTTPFQDRMMLFDESTAGLMRMNLARLAALGQNPPPSLAPWMSSLPPFAELPVVFTDSILAASFARSRVIVELPQQASAEWREAACRLPLDRIGRRLGKGTAPKLIKPDGSESPLESPAALDALTGTPGS